MTADGSLRGRGRGIGWRRQGKLGARHVSVARDSPNGKFGVLCG